MMKVWRNRLMMVVICSVLLTACGVTTKQRTAKQWLMLTQSGLTAKDDYRFTGSITQGFENGVSLTPFIFDGEVQEHKNTTLYSDQADTMFRNPVAELDFIIKNYEEVEIGKFTIDESTMRQKVMLHVVEQEEASTRRWKERLREELASITMSVSSEAVKNNTSEKQRLLQAEIDKGQQELDSMLQTLKVHVQYDLAVDVITLLPTKLNSYMKLDYVKDSVPYSEYRDTNIRFDMLNSSH